MRLKGDQSTTRALNRRLVLDELRRNGPMSRAVLADSVGLSPAAVTFVTADLLGEGLIAEGTAVAGAPGRRPIPLRIDYDSRFSAGVKIETHGVEGVVTNLATEIIAQASAPLEDFRPEAVVGAVASVVEGLFEEAGVDRGSVIGIGLAFSGEIDGETGTCRQIPSGSGGRTSPLPQCLPTTCCFPPGSTTTPTRWRFRNTSMATARERPTSR